MDTDEYARLLAHITVLERAFIALVQQQPENAQTVICAELSQMVQDSERKTRAYGEAIGQVAGRLLDDLR